ncbi:MAG: hypothetical protein JRJ84_12500, partial [Deltaproteobacteria bacterium]|nr:hypothetical protein [Deltaproteobacteria bacterium]
VQERPGYAREDLFLTMDRLYANGREQPLTWGSGKKLREMQNPKKGLPKPPPRKRVPRKPHADEGGAS